MICDLHSLAQRFIVCEELSLLRTASMAELLFAGQLNRRLCCRKSGDRHSIRAATYVV